MKVAAIIGIVLMLSTCSARNPASTAQSEPAGAADTLIDADSGTPAVESRIDLLADSIIEIKVEIVVFSGRPDPTWFLDAQEQILVHAGLVQAVPRPPQQIEGQLGYTGFRLTVQTSDQILSIQIYGGIIIYNDQGQISFYQDTDRALEQILFKTSQAHINSELYHTIEAALPEK